MPVKSSEDRMFKYMGIRTWLLAQLLTFIAYFCIIGQDAIIVSGFAVFFGLPSCVAFSIIVRAFRLVKLDKITCILLCLVLFPLITLVNAYIFLVNMFHGLAFSGLDSLPAVATLVAVTMLVAWRSKPATINPHQPKL